MADPNAVLQFWFGPLTEGFADEAHRARWFSPDAAVDGEIATTASEPRSTTPQTARCTRGWTEPSAVLAFVIVTDQFPRNVFRGSARAYSHRCVGVDGCQKRNHRGI